MKKIYITRNIPEVGIKMLREKGFEVDINPKDKILEKKELIKELKKKPYDAVLSLLTDAVDKEVFDAVPNAKIFSNYAVGFNNIDMVEAKNRDIVVTNTPGMSSETVAEHAIALILALTTRTIESDAFMRNGNYKGWDPMIFWGMDLKGKTVGILGAGRIGVRVGNILKYGFDMNVIYYDVKRNEQFEENSDAVYYDNPEEVIKLADVLTLHVPLLPSTKHLINAEHFKMMKKTVYLVNTSRGQVIDEVALVDALKNKVIAGAGLDVYEFEPKMAKGLEKLSNVVLTPHIASATETTRNQMSETSAQNIIDFFGSGESKNRVNI